MAGIVTAEAAMQAAMQAMDRRWMWGEADCCASVCAAYARLHGIDPMAALRGSYSDAAGAAGIVARAGGWDALCEEWLARAGMVEVPPQAAPPGSIGLLAPQPNGTRALAFGLGSGWAGKGARGMTLLREVARAWAAR